MKVYNKLVRDNIDKIISASGKTADIKILVDKDYKIALKTKLLEEVDEFLKAENKEEIADILEVLYAFCNLYKFNKEEIELIRQEKAVKNGAFKEKKFLISVSDELKKD